MLLHRASATRCGDGAAPPPGRGGRALATFGQVRRLGGMRSRVQVCARVGALFAAIAMTLMWTASAWAASRSWSAPITLVPSTSSAFGPGVAVFGVACPSASQCTAVDSDGKEITFDPRTSGRIVSAALDPAGGGLHGAGTVVLDGVACPSVSQCTAVDSLGREFTFDPAAPGKPTSTTIASSELFAVACPSVTQCTAVEMRARKSRLTLAAWHARLPSLSITATCRSRSRVPRSTSARPLITLVVS